MMNDRDEIKKLLTQFLCMKFEKNGYDLEKELEKSVWKEKLNNWPVIRELLRQKEHPNHYIAEDPDRGVTVILPIDNDDPDIFQFLKGAAYFPHDIDPWVYDDNWKFDKDILVKLAYATHHRYFGARNQLVWLDEDFPLLKGHRLCKYKNIPYMNEDEIYYEFDIPKIYHGKGKPKKTLKFDPYSDHVALNDFCTHLVEIAQTGKGEDPKKS